MRGTGTLETEDREVGMGDEEITTKNNSRKRGGGLK